MQIRTAVATTVLLLAAGACGNGADTGRTAAAPDVPTPVATAPGGPGPRLLPASAIDLEVAAFPRPAAEACSGDLVVEVATGESIAAALEGASAGTTIRVSAGVYVERPGEWLALELSTDDVCLRGTGDVVLEAADGQTVGISVTGDDIVVEGLAIRGFEVGIAIDGRTGETQRAVTIERTAVQATAGEFREGIVAFAESDGSEAVLDGLLLLDVTVSGTDLGVSCNTGPCHHVWMEASAVAGRSAEGGSGADAFAVEEGRQIVLVDSTVAGATADGIDAKADDVVVFGCRIFEVGRNGVKLWRGGDVINTIVDGTGADAALVGEEPGTYRYVHTLVAHHGEPGERAYLGTWSYDARSSDIVVEIVNSIFWDNVPGGFFVPEGATLSIRHSLLAGAADDPLLTIGDDEAFRLKDLAAFETAGFGAANLIGDPRFLDAAGHDYGTAPGSPARDAGETVPGLTVDANGDRRVRGAAPDIGPTES